MIKKIMINIPFLLLVAVICSCASSKLSVLNGNYKIKCIIIPHVNVYKTAISTPKIFNSNYKNVKKKRTLALSLEDLKLVDSLTSDVRFMDIKNKVILQKRFGKKTVLYANSSGYVLFNGEYYFASEELITLIDFFHSWQLPEDDEFY